MYKDIIIKEDYKKYFNVNRLYSYTNANMYILIGGRGIGKTTSICLKVWKNYCNTGEQFVIVRRYKTELTKVQGIFNNLVKGITTKGMGNGVFAFIHSKKIIGFGIALTVQQTVKSGVDFSKVKTLMYDEAILKPRGTYRYLKDEIEVLFELMSSVFRDRKDYKIFIIGNNADLFNPYFAYFNIPRFEKKYFDKDRGIYCELSDINPILLESEKETPLYSITKGTAYADYHYQNKVLISDSMNIVEKLPTDRLLVRLIYETYTLNIYQRKLFTLFIEKKDNAIEDNLTFHIQQNLQPNYTEMDLFKKTDLCKLLSMSYYKQQLLFSDEISHSLLKEILNNLHLI